MVQIRRFGSSENFECKREKLAFNAFVYAKPVKRAKNQSDVTEFWRFDSGTCKRVLDLLETG